MTRPDAVVLACIVGLALLGFFQFPGHTWLQQDTQIWVPMLEHIWDPTALRHDLVALKPHLSFTIYDETAIAIRWITRASFETVLELEQFLCRILELLGAFWLARSFGLDRRMSLLVTACFGLGAAIVGPSVLTFEYEPVPRGFALGFLFLAIGLATRRHAILAACVAALGILFHAPTAIPVCILFIVNAFRRREYKPLIPLACAFLLLLIASRFQAGATESQPFFETIDPDWERIERLRASYNWISVWVTPLLWQYVFLTALTFLALWRMRPANGRLFTLGLPLIGLLSLPVSYLFLERMKWAIMPQLQPARALLWVTAMAVIVSAAAAVRAGERRIWWESILWFALVFAIPIEPRIGVITIQHLLLALGLAAIAASSVLLANRPGAVVALAAAIILPYFAIPIAGAVRNYPTLHTPELTALAAYARTSTPKDAVFLFPDAGRALDPGLFRAAAIRSVYVDWKAGGQVNYFRSLAEEWWTRWQATMTGSNIFANEPGIDYVVTRSNNPIPHRTPIYANNRYLIYSLTNPRSTGPRP